MALWKSSAVKDFCFAQILPILIHFFIMAIFAVNSYNVKHFFYIMPVIFLLMFHLYQCFWKPKTKCTLAFKIIITILFFVFAGTFFGIFIGMFGQVLSYPLEEVKNCQVTGQLLVHILGIEKYSILYVNYEKDGETYLGYGCTAGQSQITAGIYPLMPYQFYQYGQFYGCGDVYPDSSYYYKHRVLGETKKQNRMTYYNDIYNKRFITTEGCLEKWSFSEVKLPSWMCLPSDFPFEGLMSIKKCYISYFGDKKGAINNAKNRSNLKEASNFVIVGFTNLLVPFDQYILFLIFCYCPLVVSFNFFTAPISHRMTKFFKEASLKYKNKFTYVPYYDRNVQNTDVYNNIQNQISPYFLHEQHAYLMQESEQNIFKLDIQNNTNNQPEIEIPEIIIEEVDKIDDERNVQTIRNQNKNQLDAIHENDDDSEESSYQIERSASASNKSYKDSPQLKLTNSF